VSRVRSFLAFVIWTVLPIAGAAAVTLFGAVGQSVKPVDAGPWRVAAVVTASILALLLIGKSIRDRARMQSLETARYDALSELHDRLAPALDLMTEMAFLQPSDKKSRRLMLRNVASDCCSALVAMTPSSKDVRATVFQFEPPDTIGPLARFGRQDLPRTFSLDTPEGREVMTFLESRSDGELYTDTVGSPPPDYTGDRSRYRTFIRVPIRGKDVVFGMLTVDAPKRRSLKVGDVGLANLVAAELGAAFAIAAA
jgi:hypothetical protein